MEPVKTLWSKVHKRFQDFGSEVTYRQERQRFARHFPQLTGCDREIVAQLQHEGVAVTSLDALATGNSIASRSPDATATREHLGVSAPNQRSNQTT